MKLRKLAEKDAERMLGWMHEEAMREIFAKDFSALERGDVLEFIKNAQEDERNLHYACVNDEDEYLGTVSLKNIDRENKNAEYAISFTAEARGTGAAKFATEEILRIGFKELGLHRIYLDVLRSNARAVRFYEKVGFVVEGVAKGHIVKNGEYQDLIWLRMLEEEYEEKAAR